MHPRLLVELPFRLAQVTQCRPGVRGSARDLPVAEVPSRNPAVAGRALELAGRVVVQCRSVLEVLDDFVDGRTLSRRH